MVAKFNVNIAFKESYDYKPKNKEENVKLYVFVDNFGNLMEPITLPYDFECEPNTPCIATLVLKSGRNRRTGEYYNRWSIESIEVKNN